jgi:pimeloyl-ACP methyl ester carboxylesterase
VKKALRISAFVLLGLLVAVFITFRFFMDFTVKPEQINQRYAEKGMAPPVFDTLAVNGHSIRFTATGDPTRPWVVWVHGSPGTWDAFISYLTDYTLREKYYQIAIDRPGYGGASKAPVSSLEMQAAPIAALLERAPEGVPRIVAGHSFGGPVVVRLAMDHPNCVEGIFVMAGFTDPALGKRPWLFRQFRKKPLRWLVPPDLNMSNDEITPIGEELALMAPSWHKLTLPVAWIQGDKDMLVPTAHLDYALANLPKPPAVLHRLPEENHFIPWSQRALVMSALDSLAAQVAR